MRERLLTGLGWLHAFLILSSILAVYPFVLLEPDMMGYLKLHLLWVPIVLSSYAYRHFQKVWQYLLYFVAVMGFGYFVSTNIMEAIFMMILCLMICFSLFLARWNAARSWMEVPGPFALVPFIILYIMGGQMDSQPLKMLIYYHTGIYVICFFLYHNLSGVSTFLSEYKKVQNMPAHAIRNLHNIAMGIFTAVTAAIIIVVPFGTFDRMFQLLKKLLTALAKAFIWLLNLFAKGAAEEETVAETAAETAEYVMQEAAEVPAWWEFLMKVLDFLAAAAVTLAVIAAAAYGLYYLYKKFYENALARETGDEAEFIGPLTKRERALSPRRQGKKRSGLFDFSPNTVVRKKYRKIIESHLEEPPYSWETPAELEASAQIAGQPEHPEIHTLYEKARYSEQGCDAEEAARMRKVRL